MMTANNKRSNYSIFVPAESASPKDGLMAHIASLGKLARLDFERCAVAGEIIYAVEGDAAPVAQADEEARIGTLAYALKKLDNAANAAEFMRCLNALCEEGDARYRQVVASYYYGEIAVRGCGEVLKEMALLAMQLASLHPVLDEAEECEWANDSSEYDDEENEASLFAQEVAAMTRLVSGRRRAARLPQDDAAEWLVTLEAEDASVEELDAAFGTIEALEQYDEGGAVMVMSSHERTVVCGRLDQEFSDEDLPECAQYLAGELRRGYVNGVALAALWEDIDAQLEVIFPVSGRTKSGAKFYSHANRAWQQFSRQVLEALLAECEQDFHLHSLRVNRSYRELHRTIRRATDTRVVSETMQQAWQAREAGALPVKHLAALKTAAMLQRERLAAERPSMTAVKLLQEVERASAARLRFLSWACYGNNQPQHPIHVLSSQDQSKIWTAIKTRKAVVTVRVNV